MGQLKTILHNDLERVVIACEPIIKYIKDTIVSSGAVGAIVSGSGPSVFGVFNSRKEANAAKKFCLKRISDKVRCDAFVAGTY